uniref:Uncharacterized protein n=1 Tax=Onchocerca volvulus TaxID=6282 RepID=A0A8R1Y5U0_ONCVO
MTVTIIESSSFLLCCSRNLKLGKVIKPAQIALNYNKLGLSAIGDKNSVEGKALDSAHSTYKEVETLLQYFESSYEKVGALLDLFGKPSLGSMIKRVLKDVPELRRLRLSSIDVAEVDDELMDLIVNEPRFTPEFNLP